MYSSRLRGSQSRKKPTNPPISNVKHIWVSEPDMNSEAHEATSGFISCKITDLLQILFKPLAKRKILHFILL